MKALEEALIRHLKVSRNFGDFLVFIALIRVDGILDSVFNFTSRFSHVGWFNRMIKMMGGKFDDYYHGGEIIAAVWRAHTENGWARGGAIRY